MISATIIGLHYRLLIAATVILILIMVGCDEQICPNGDCVSNTPIPDDEFINEMVFVDSFTGWVVTISNTTKTSQVYKTTDGGYNWILQLKNLKTFDPHLSFVDKYYGWIALDSGNVLKTTDGGWSWLTQHLVTSKHRITSIYFQNRSHGWVTTVGLSGLVGIGEIYRTTNGGDFWERRYDGRAGALTSIYAIEENIWAVGGGVVDQYSPPLALYSLDGGDEFKEAIISEMSGPFRHVRFIDGKTGITGGLGGVYTSHDSGKSWSKNANTSVYSISASKSESTVRLAGSDAPPYQSAIYKSTNEGLSWSTEWEKPDDTLRIITRLYFIDKDNGWASGFDYDSSEITGNPIIMKYTRSTWDVIYQQPQKGVLYDSQ